MNKEFRDDFAVYCCSHVFHNQRPVLLVIRDPEGDWQFLCGFNDDDMNTCHHVGAGHLLEMDKTLAVVAKLSISSGVERDNVDDEWKYFDLD